MSIHRTVNPDKERRREEAVALRRAREEREQTGPSGELAVLEEAVGTLGPSWRLMAERGRVLEELGQAEQARWSYERAIRLGDRTGRSQYHAGWILLGQGRLQQADRSFAEAIRLADGMAEAWLARGITALQADRPGEALGFFDEAAKRQPAWAEPPLRAALALHQDGRLHDALDRYDAILGRLGPTTGPDTFRARVLGGQADSLAAVGRHSEALVVAEKGLEFLDPAAPEAEGPRLKLAARAFDAAWKSKQYSRMKEHGPVLLRAFAPTVGISVYAAYMAAAAEDGDYPGAWRNLAEMGRLYAECADQLVQQPLDYEQWLSFSGMLLLLGEHAEAERALGRAMQGAPDEGAKIDVYLQMVTLYFERRDEADPADWLRLHRLGLEAARAAEGLLLARLRTRRTAEILHYLGSLYLVLEDHEQARSYLQQAVDAAPEHPETRARLGIACAALGDGKEALRLLRSCVAADPLQFELAEPLAWAYRLEGALDRAEDVLRAVIRRAPGLLAPEVALAEVLISRGDEGDADAFAEAEQMLAQTIRRSRDTAVAATGERLTAGRLSSRREAEALYARAYALVRTTESAAPAAFLGSGVGATLETAERLFAEAAAADPSNPRALRARDAVCEYRRSSAASRRVDRIGVPLLLLVEFVLLGVVQAGFLGVWPGARLEAGYYVVATFGLLVMVIATMYLPTLLRLKVVGVELEKAADDRTGPAPTLQLKNVPSLQVSRAIGRLALPEPPAPVPDRKPPVDAPGVPSEPDARAGARTTSAEAAV